MTCHDAREQFSGLVDDALSADERATLDAHLATCADCRRELQRFRDTVGLLGALAPVRAPAGFVDRVLDAARPVSWPRRLVRGLFVPWPVKLPMEAAAIVLVAVGVGLVYRGTPEIQEADRQVSTTASIETRAPESRAPREPAPAPSPLSSSRRDEFVARGLDKSKDRASSNAPERAKESEPAPTIEKKTAAAKAQPPEAVTRETEPQPKLDRQARQEASGKLEAPPAVAERERAMAREQRSAPAPAPGARADTAQAPRSTVTGSSFAPPDVSGRLAVSDRELALRGIGELVERLGAVEHRRFDVSDGQIVELTVPREAYAEFVRELARLGRWQPSTEPAALPAQIRVFLRITS